MTTAPNSLMPRPHMRTAPASTPRQACGKVKAFSPDVLVVSLGVDTYEKDPISYFKLKSADFRDYGRRIAKLKLPTLFVMEGGYAIEAIGVNTVNVLEGFLDA
mgnify:CR=1 FL=1